MKHPFDLSNVHTSWHAILESALATLKPAYLEELTQDTAWLPGKQKIFNAFSQPLSQTRYVLMGESPYPRSQSANGYAFWDDAVNDLWSDTGLSKPVNRATSMRNILKMLLVTHSGLSADDTTQQAIAATDKTQYVQTNAALFKNLSNAGFLLLNASLVFRPKKVPLDAKAWLPFMEKVLEALLVVKPDAELILFGKIADKINRLSSLDAMSRFSAEHPYNLSFINNKAVQDFFRPLRLLDKR